MINDDIKRILIEHLGGQFERALPVLFTGCGFSLSAMNIRGQALPSVQTLKEELWKICFPGEIFEATTSLQDLYEHALLRHRNQLTELMTAALSVDADSLPGWYKTIFSMPWARAYTLNVDDLIPAVGRKFELPRRMAAISATTGPTDSAGPDAPQGTLEVVYLNGTPSDIPDHVTFSVRQYADRLSRTDPWYLRLVSELVSRSFVFIGTSLDEPPLWQHLELRRTRGSHSGRPLRELRPKSYLVTPRLDRARQALLSEFNVVWVPLTAEEFAIQVLGDLGPAAQKGFEKLAILGAAIKDQPPVLPEVAKIAINPLLPSEFLMGQQPIWADLQSGRAIERESDGKLWSQVQAPLKRDGRKGVVVVTGTAGSGKSTALMRVCLRLVAEGTRVGWLDKMSDLSPRDIRNQMRAEDAPGVLAVDDADLYGSYLAGLVRELATDDRSPLILLGIRAGKVDRVLNPVVLRDVPVSEFAMPILADSDIGPLIDALDKANRLGTLKGRTRDEQIRTFKHYANRQLLVAMLNATSDGRFREKILEELTDLEAEGRTVYAMVAVASAFRFGLFRDEVLIATGDSSNVVLNALDRLVGRHVLAPATDGSIWARHRVIAETLLDALQKTGQLTEVLSGLALVGATKVSPSLQRSARPWRLLRAILNHDFLERTIGTEGARNLYGDLEQILSFDSHYWLQRGSLEVEFGGLDLAENFLSQAAALAPDDPFVQNEQAYLFFRKAIDNPNAPGAPALVEDATRTLEDLILDPGTCGPYPYHVLGSQGLAWARRGIRSSSERERYLRKIIKRVEDGQKKFPREAELQKLLEDLKRAYLEIAVGPGRPS